MIRHRPMFTYTLMCAIGLVAGSLAVVSPVVAQTMPASASSSTTILAPAMSGAQGQAPVMSMHMGSMQGGSAPPNARSPDYSDGIAESAMTGMDMDDNAPLSMLQFDQLEAFHGKKSNGQSWELQGWYGNDSDKLWIRSEGERSHRRIEDGDAEALWSHAVAAFWNTQLGVRQDVGEGPSRRWAAIGIQGLAPYLIDVEATAYVGSSGRTAARVRGEYELLFTQRLILQTELEVNAYGHTDPVHRLGRGISDAELGMRLRYEFHRQFAPYIGVVWTDRFGDTAGFARGGHQAVFDRLWVAGLHFWF